MAEAPPPATITSIPLTAGEPHKVLFDDFDEEKSFLNSRMRAAAQPWNRLLIKSAQLSARDFYSRSNDMVEQRSVSLPLTAAEICS